MHESDNRRNETRREDDRKWTIERRLTQIEKTLEAIDLTLRGDPLDMRSGIVGRLEQQEEKIARLMAVIFMDSACDRGILAEFQKLQRKERRWETNRTGLTAVVVAIITTAGLIIKWPDIQALFRRESPVSMKERLDLEIADLKKTHGPDVKKRIEELQKASDRYTGKTEAWK